MSIADLYLPLAHAGEIHWYFIPILAVPVLLILYYVLQAARAKRRREPG